MPRLKVSPEVSHMEPEAGVVEPEAAILVKASSDMIPHESPALALQASLEKSWEARHDHEAVQTARVPFGWTLIGVSLVCAAFWYTLLQLIF